MALDLYINNERTANSSLFYRITSNSSYTFNIKLSDELLPDHDFSAFYVEYTVNNQLPAVRWEADPNGLFILTKTFNAGYPCVSSVQVYVSGGDLLPALTAANTPAGSFALSAKFIPRYPTIDYVAYPSLYVDIKTATFKTITSSNYMLSSRGLSAYGEGHTEVVNLSSNNYSGSGNVLNWFVGNTINEIVSAAKTAFDTGSDYSSVLPILTSTSTATVAVTSDVGSYTVELASGAVALTGVSNSYPEYPISLMASNNYILRNGPIITYRDSDGKKMYYPFFTSSLSADNFTKVQRIEKSSIKIMPYPQSFASITIDTPFKQDSIFLPFGYNKQSFVTSTDIHNVFNNDALEETFAGTQWEVIGTSKGGDWHKTPTPFLSSIFAYKFDLMYERDTASTALLPFKASAIYPTTINLNLSSYRNCILKLPTINGVTPPQDWKYKLVPVVNTLSAVVNPIPFDKIYTPNYFNVKDQDVSFTIISTPQPPYSISKLTLKSENSLESLTLTTDSPSGTMKFNTLGVVDLSATALLKNAVSGNVVDVSFIYQDMIEVVKSFDEPSVDPDYFHTILTPLNLTYTSQPRLAPNEWAIADNVNSIIEKIYTTTTELLHRGRVYNQKNKWYGYLEPTEKTSVLKTPDQYEWFSPPHLWIDLDCRYAGGATDETASWEKFESAFCELSATWEWQDCGQRLKIDPSCFEKYCVQWNWKWRKKGASTIDVTWADTKLKNIFQKKWKWERCTVDAVNINCDRTKWNVVTVEPELFPFATTSYTDRCAIVDCEVNIQTDQIVLAHRTEVHLVDKDYYCNHTARTGMADDLFSFQNIVGLSTNAEGKLAVLDGTLPRVSVYTIYNNDFIPFTTWGVYGLAQTPQGLKDPLDIHIDGNNSIWIADTGNNCIKKFTLLGKPQLTITHSILESQPPLSICVDSKDNIHCLTYKNVVVFDKDGNYSFEYDFDSNLDGTVSKINVSFNKEIIYITYQYGIAKHFRNGVFFGYVIKDVLTKDRTFFEGYNSISQDRFRNLYTTANDKILQIQDLQETVPITAAIPADLYWDLSELMIHKEEYIQPWVYLKAFHRLWDNIELIRNSIFYVPDSQCKSFKPATYSKEELTIGQNEIVTNAVINRLSEQLWTNLKSIIDYFDPNCEN